MNVVVLIGRLTADPQTSYKGDLTIAKFTLAVDKEGREGGTNFIRVTSFGRTAENVATYLGKGSQCCVRGRIETGSYEGKHGKVYTTEVISDRVEFIGSRESRGESREEEEPETYGAFTATNDDIPF